MKSKLPNFLVVGAAKCGTSSLHNYLNQHSDIFMPTYNKDGMKVKEPRFFIKDIVQNRLPQGVWDWDEYKALFDDIENQKCIGESTVLYLYFYEHAIKNIKKYLQLLISFILIFVVVYFFIVLLNKSITFVAAPTIDGANELENKYGRDFCLNMSIISFLPEVKPPIAPPKALPKVEVIISTLPITPQCSCVPLPVFPTKPVE